MEWTHGDFVITTDPARVDLDVVHGFLSGAYWCEGIPREVVERSLEGSIPFSMWHGGRQVGFARVVSDRATFAWVGDVFVLESYRGRGLSVWLMRVVCGHPELQGLRRWMLATRDAHRLYDKVGFTPLHAPERFMERWTPDPYRATPNAG
jgi:GNAT superfamily N-acetyltransferase